jgi:hypothetical protein
VEAATDSMNVLLCSSSSRSGRPVAPALSRVHAIGHSIVIEEYGGSPGPLYSEQRDDDDQDKDRLAPVCEEVEADIRTIGYRTVPVDDPGCDYMLEFSWQ